ncbi:type II and III secretion system protein, partial [bacterium]
LKGRQRDIDEAIKLVKSIDVAPLQVVLDVRIVDTSPEFAELLGLKWDFGTLKFGEGGNRLLPDPAGLSRSRLDINAIIDAQTVKTDVKVLARPSIHAIDNEEANFFVGDTYRYPVTSSGGLGAQNISIEEFPVGIGLRFRPRIGADGMITLVLNPFVKTINGFSNGLPQETSREATTTVLVRDGETLVLGGLIRDEDRRILTEVPFLSRLPIVGQLFRHRERNRRQSNVIFTLTPRIVRNTAQ